MLTLIEALNYRCLKYVRQPLSPFHVLVGPNASGKTTFLDVVSLLGRLVSSGLKEALAERAPTFDDLLYLGKGNKFELAVEARIPDHLLDAVKTSKSTFQVIRYEVSIEKDSETEEVMLLGESVRLKTSQEVKSVKRQLFPSPPPPPDTIFERKQQGTRTTVNKVHCGNDNFYSETYTTSGKGWAPAFKLGPLKSALGNLPEDESKFPVSTWLKGLLSDGIHQVILESLAMRKASKPG